MEVPLLLQLKRSQQEVDPTRGQPFGPHEAVQ